MKHHDSKQLREERDYLAYASSSLSITEGSQVRHSNGTGAEAGADVEAMD